MDGGGAALGARRVRLRWEERGGPPVAPPAARGFGTDLIERVATDELGARPELTFASAGLEAEIVVPLGQVPFSNPR